MSCGHICACDEPAKEVVPGVPCPCRCHELRAQLSTAQERIKALEQECASISAEFGLPPTIRPAEGEITRMRNGWSESQERIAKLEGALEACLKYIPGSEVRSWPPGFELRKNALTLARAALSDKESGT